MAASGKCFVRPLRTPCGCHLVSQCWHAACQPLWHCDVGGLPRSGSTICPTRSCTHSCCVTEHISGIAARSLQSKRSRQLELQHTIRTVCHHAKYNIEGLPVSIVGVAEDNIRRNSVWLLLTAPASNCIRMISSQGTASSNVPKVMRARQLM